MIEWKQASHSDVRVPVVRGQALASLRSPADEARKWLQSIDAKDGTTVVILGFGAGIHVEEFRRKYPNCKVIVYELHLELNLKAQKVSVDEVDLVLEFRPAWGAMKAQYLELKTELLGDFTSFNEYVRTLEDQDRLAASVIQEFIR